MLCINSDFLDIKKKKKKFQRNKTIVKHIVVNYIPSLSRKLYLHNFNWK